MVRIDNNTSRAFFAYMSLAYSAVGQMSCGRRIWGAFLYLKTTGYFLFLAITRMVIRRCCPNEISQMEGLLLYLLLVKVGFGGDLVINYLISRNRNIQDFLPEAGLNF